MSSATIQTSGGRKKRYRIHPTNLSDFTRSQADDLNWENDVFQPLTKLKGSGH